MNKLLTVTLLTAAALGGWVAAQSSAASTVGVLYDAGGKFDKSFNQSAYEGTLRVERNLGLRVIDFVGKPNATEGDIQAGLTGLVDAGAGLVIGMGYANNERLSTISAVHPDRQYVLVDDTSTSKNVTSVLFREEEGSYLAGYIAAQATSTGRIGFVGGMPIELIHKFAAGFKAGVAASGKPITVQSVFVGNTPDAWDNTKRASEIATNLTKKGVDVIFAAAGAAGQGVIDVMNKKQCLKAADLPAGVKFLHNNYQSVPKSAAYKAACGANSRPLFFIGVDSNQNYLGDDDKNPATLNHGLTSMTKRVDNAVYTVSSAFKAGNLKPGTLSFGLKEGGISYAVDQYNRALMTKTILQRTERLKARIIRGVTKVAAK